MSDIQKSALSPPKLLLNDFKINQPYIWLKTEKQCAIFRKMMYLWLLGFSRYNGKLVMMLTCEMEEGLINMKHSEAV